MTNSNNPTETSELVVHSTKITKRPIRKLRYGLRVTHMIADDEEYYTIKDISMDGKIVLIEQKQRHKTTEYRVPTNLLLEVVDESESELTTH